MDIQKVIRNLFERVVGTFSPRLQTSGPTADYLVTSSEFTVK